MKTVLFPKLLLFVFILSTLASCDVCNKDVERLAKQASKGHEQSMLMVVKNEKMFSKVVDEETRQKYLDELLQRGNHAAILYACNQDIAQQIRERTDRTKRIDRNAIRVKWGVFGISHNCKACYSDLYDIYRGEYARSKKLTDSLTSMMYYQQAIEAHETTICGREALKEGPFSVFLVALHETKERLINQESYSPLNFISSIFGTFSRDFYGGITTQVTMSGHWWKALLVVIASLIALFLGIGYCTRLAPQYKNSANVAHNGLLLGLVNSFFFAFFQSWPVLTNDYPIQLCVGRFLFPDTAYGYMAWLPIIFTYIFFVWAVVCYDIYHDVRYNRSDDSAMKVIGTELYIFLLSYSLSAFFGGLSLILLIVGFCLYVGGAMAIHAIMELPGMVFSGLSNAFSFESAVSSGGRSYTDYSSSSSSYSSSSDSYDTVIHGGGTLGNDIKAHTNADGSLTDEHGGTWESDSYGNYSKKS